MILRVEGRTPNDDDAVYRLHFGGSFEPITSGPLAEHEDAIQPATAVGGVGKSGEGECRLRERGSTSPALRLRKRPRRSRLQLNRQNPKQPPPNALQETAGHVVPRHEKRVRLSPRNLKRLRRKARQKTSRRRRFRRQKPKTPAKGKRPTRRSTTARHADKPPASSGTGGYWPAPDN